MGLLEPHERHGGGDGRADLTRRAGLGRRYRPMRNWLALLLAAIVLMLAAADLALGWGGSVAAGRWLFALIDWLAFWRYF